jgi:hypothetical protein
MNSFTTSTRNLLKYSTAAGVRHYFFTTFNGTCAKSVFGLRGGGFVLGMHTP